MGEDARSQPLACADTELFSPLPPNNTHDPLQKTNDSICPHMTALLLKLLRSNHTAIKVGKALIWAICARRVGSVTSTLRTGQTDD